MVEAATSVLSGWESFYVIVGSSGAALIGLQFVVIVLIADVRIEGSGDSIAAFGTPTVMHFASALAVSAVMSAPWGGLTGVRTALGLAALAGLWFVVRAMIRARRQQSYKPVLEDWIWHTLLPLVAYSIILIAAILAELHTLGAFFAVATAALGLLFIGIHNAWDTVVWIVVNAKPDLRNRP
ncbi:MAG TPA: hypothetical protein VNS10_00920 [Gemmatimonadaceae bacterium]|jgi:hypothetical protein|nr:hypothetical protein [Gemmatimonadaceae bacterium]